MVPLLIGNYSGSSVSLSSSFSFFTGWSDFYCSYHPRFVALLYVQGCVSWTRTDESTFEDKYFQVWTLNSGNPSLISSAIHYVWLWSAWPLFSCFQWSGWSLAKFERIPLVGGRKVPHAWSALASAGSKCKHIVNVFFIGIPYQKLGFLVPDFTECLKII